MQQAWSTRTSDADRIVLHLRIEDPAAQSTGNVAWPAEIYLEAILPAATPTLELTLTTLDKRDNRLPEAMWLTFAPAAINPTKSTVNKAGETIALSGVVAGGGRNMHAVQDRITLVGTDLSSALEILTLDAPVVALGQRTPLNFSPNPPDLSQGVHFSLFNNAWGTNYPQWAAGSWQHRFTLKA